MNATSIRSYRRISTTSPSFLRCVCVLSGYDGVAFLQWPDNEAMSGGQIRQWSNPMQVSSPVSRAESRGFQPGRKTVASAASRGAVENGVSAPQAKDVVKIRGCRVSAPIMQPWGECCRIVEWINRNGEYSCIAVRGAATVAEIRERVRMHRNGQRHTLADDAATPAGRVRLRRG